MPPSSPPDDRATASSAPDTGSDGAAPDAADQDAAVLRATLVDRLTADGWLRNPALREAFLTVPRHVFLARFFQPTPDGRYRAVDHIDPDWLTLTYQDDFWATQLDGDPGAWQRARATGPITGTMTCTSSMPSLMAYMLEALNPQPGEHVLEIGTGTGYNAALLTHRLGPDHVTTVDIDETLVAAARRALAGAGYHPTVAAGDGLAGWQPSAPYHRILATCSVTRIPPAWIGQLRPGGTLLAYPYRELSPAGNPALLLTASSDGTASGPLLPHLAAFMPARADHVHDRLAAAVRQPADETRPTALHPDQLSPVEALLVPDITRLGFQPTDRPEEIWLFHRDRTSWACYIPETGTIEQYGPQRIWDQLEYAHELYETLGRPATERFGMHVDTTGMHRLWLDGCTNTVATAALP